MKALKILNRINTLMLFSYIPFILIDYDNFFNGKTNTQAITVLSLALFLTTFVCGGIILVAANKTNVENGTSLQEIFGLGAKKLILAGVNLAVNIALFLIFVKSDILIFYIPCTVISTGFVIAEKIIIANIDVSPYYKITLPWYTFPVPFVYFISSNIWASYHLNENQLDSVLVFNFVLSGLMMMYCAWHFCYIIDENAKTIEKEYGVFSFFIPNKAISFERISYVTKKGLFYTVSDGETTFKIGRYMSSAKRLEKALSDNGILLVDSKLL